MAALLSAEVTLPIVNWGVIGLGIVLGLLLALRPRKRRKTGVEPIEAIEWLPSGGLAGFAMAFIGIGFFFAVAAWFVRPQRARKRRRSSDE